VEVDEDCEVEIKHNPPPTSDKFTLSKALKSVDKLNLVKYEAKYQTLIEEIRKYQTTQTARKRSKYNPFSGVKRGDICPCGTGKKFKICHGKHNR